MTPAEEQKLQARAEREKRREAHRQQRLLELDRRDRAIGEALALDRFRREIVQWVRSRTFGQEHETMKLH
jgi:hypothetical protein